MVSMDFTLFQPLFGLFPIVSLHDFVDGFSLGSPCLFCLPLIINRSASSFIFTLKMDPRMGSKRL